MSQMCNNNVKIQILQLLTNLKHIVQKVYHNSYLNCKQISIAGIHLRFQGYVRVSLVVVYITVSEWAPHGRHINKFKFSPKKYLLWFKLSFFLLMILLWPGIMSVYLYNLSM
jgi:hypothetical protein